MSVVLSRGPLTPVGIAEEDHRLNTPRPGTGTVITRPIEDRLRLLVPPRTFCASKDHCNDSAEALQKRIVVPTESNGPQRKTTRH